MLPDDHNAVRRSNFISAAIAGVGYGGGQVIAAAGSVQVAVCFAKFAGGSTLALAAIAAEGAGTICSVATIYATTTTGSITSATRATIGTILYRGFAPLN